MEHLGPAGWGRGCKTTAQRWTRLTTALINQGFLPVWTVSGKRRDDLTFRGKMSRVRHRSVKLIYHPTLVSLFWVGGEGGGSALLLSSRWGKLKKKERDSVDQMFGESSVWSGLIGGRRSIFPNNLDSIPLLHVIVTICTNGTGATFKTWWLCRTASLPIDNVHTNVSVGIDRYHGYEINT